MGANEIFDQCVRAFWLVLQKYRRLNADNPQAEKLLSSILSDFWYAELAVIRKLDTKRAREMAKVLNIDFEKSDKRLEEFS